MKVARHGVPGTVFGAYKPFRLTDLSRPRTTTRTRTIANRQLLTANPQLLTPTPQRPVHRSPKPREPRIRHRITQSQPLCRSLSIRAAFLGLGLGPALDSPSVLLPAKGHRPTSSSAGPDRWSAPCSRPTPIHRQASRSPGQPCSRGGQAEIRNRVAFLPPLTRR